MANHRERKHPIKAIIIHSTGEKDLAKVLHYYQTSSEGIGPHYVIACDGSVTALVDESQVAYHAGFGAGQVALYKQGFEIWGLYSKVEGEPAPVELVNYDSWDKRWPDKHSPLDLCTGESPNELSIGIECQEPSEHLPDHFTDAQYAGLATLIRDILSRHGQLELLGHSDVNPISRCNSHGSWDPGENFNWVRLRGMLT